MEIKRTANAGVLLTLDGVTILLDGVNQPFQPYLGTPGHIRQALLQAPPDLVAFTHRHPDHCDVSFVSDYLQNAAGPIMGPADIPFSSNSERTVGGVKVTPVANRHLGRACDVQHMSFVLEGSRCVWFLGDASPLPWKSRQDLPRPDVVIAPFAYATAGGWDVTRSIGPKALVLVHMPPREDDPACLWQQVEATVGQGNGPAVYIPEMGQKIRFAEG